MKPLPLALVLALGCGQSEAKEEPAACPACPECKAEPAKPPTEAEAWAVISKSKKKTQGVACDAARLLTVLSLSAPEMSQGDTSKLAVVWFGCSLRRANMSDYEIEATMTAIGRVLDGDPAKP